MKANILIIDDSAALAESLASILRMEEYQVAIVSNGAKALRVIESQAPDLVITDLIMPELNGIELIRILRARAEFRNLPIIALSADTREGRSKEGLEAGANYFFTKPFDENILIEKIEQLLSK